MRQGLSERLASALLSLLLVLPWVQPFSSGPSRNTWSWLISAACLAGVMLLRRHLDARRAALALLAAALLNAAMALVQYLGLSPHLQPWVWTAGPGEGFGNLRQRNQFGSLTALGLAGLLAWVGSRGAAQPDRRVQVGVASALPLLALGNAASLSRTGLLAWMGVALAWAVFSRHRHWPGMILALVALPLAGLSAVVLPKLLPFVHPASDAACTLADCGALGRLAQSGSDSRLVLWRNVLHLIAERPWTGWGWGELGHAHYMVLQPSERFPDKLANAHNLPLHLAVELGVPAAVLLCSVVLAGVIRARPWRETDPWRWAAWAMLAVVGFHSLLEYPLWYGPFQVAVLVGLACLAPGLAEWSRRWLVNLSACALLAAVLALGLDYQRVSQPYLKPDQRSAWLPGDPLAQALRSRWFRPEAEFAQLALTPLNAGNAAEQYARALALLHHSAEPWVIERLLDSARLLDRHADWEFHAQRYEAAYPQAHALWRARQSP